MRVGHNWFTFMLWRNVKVPYICPLKGLSLSPPLPGAAGLAAGRDKPLGQPRSLWAVSGAWWQHEPSRDKTAA